ncbi:MAG: energy transducer TonB [Prolixibacteraceae bacterium]
MEKLQRFYRININGIIATLAIHLVVLVSLLFARLKNNHELPLEALFVDLTTEEMKLPDPEKERLDQGNQSLAFNASHTGQHNSNRAVNLGNQSGHSTSDPFFDKEYARELAAAKQLERDVSRNLSKKIPQIGDIPMPVASTEGMTREEAKRSTFRGKSNIHYLLGNRFHLQLPIPVYLAQGGGEVVVDIVVDRNGEVISANPQESAKISDPMIFAYARQAAEKTVFNPDNAAPDKQRGTITYLFVAQ